MTGDALNATLPAISAVPARRVGRASEFAGLILACIL